MASKRTKQLMARQMQAPASFTPQQVQGYVWFSLFFVVFYVLIVVNLPKIWLKIAIVAFTFGASLVVTCTVFCSCGSARQTNSWANTGKKCESCRQFVEATSVHCDVCRICVSGHRHHSDWLNACVGTRNFCAYLGLLVGLLLASAVELASGLWVAAVVLHGEEAGRSLAAVRYTQKYSLNDGGYCFKITLLFVSATSLAVLLAALANLAMHTCICWTRKSLRVTSQAALDYSSNTGVSAISADLEKRVESSKTQWRLAIRKASDSSMGNSSYDAGYEVSTCRDVKEIGVKRCEIQFAG